MPFRRKHPSREMNSIKKVSGRKREPMSGTEVESVPELPPQSNEGSHLPIEPKL